MVEKIIVLTGTPGAGKSTVLNAALHQMKDDSAVHVVNYADVMLSVGKDLGLGSDHDAIRKQPYETQRELQKKAGEEIAKLAKGKAVTVVDTHATIKTPTGYLPGLPAHVVKAINPQTIVIVEASSADLLKRRSGDDTRERDAETEEDLERHAQINRAAAMASAVLCGATVKVIQNKQDKMDEAAAELLPLLEE